MKKASECTWITNKHDQHYLSSRGVYLANFGPIEKPNHTYHTTAHILGIERSVLYGGDMADFKEYLERQVIKELATILDTLTTHTL